MNSTNINEASCQKRVDRFNRILRKFYQDTKSLYRNRVAEFFTTSGDATINTLYPIYKVRGFFGTGCSSCLLPMDQCKTCCMDGLQKINMKRTYSSVERNQYKLECQDKVKASFDSGLDEQGRIVYSRGPQTITSINDEICIDDILQTGLEHLIDYFYAVRDKEFTAAQFYMNEYKERLQQEEESQAQYPNFITTDYPTNY